MNAIWDRIESWLAKNAPDILAELCEGADAADLRWAEEQMGVTFPDDVRACYLRHDGCDGDLLDGWDFLSINQVVAAWRKLKVLYEKRVFAPDPQQAREGTATPHGPFQPHWWNPRWLPFTEFDGYHHCIDLIPADGGHPGQVLFWDRAMGERYLVAATFSDLWAKIADDLESGQRYLDAEGCWAWVIEKDPPFLL